MTDATLAVQLTQAADKLRHVATAATPGAWRAEELPPNAHHKKHAAHWVKTEWDDGLGTTHQTVADCPWRQADAELIAAMHPGVALALADWLEATAAAMGWLAPYRTGENGHEMWTAALATARAILGEVTR